MNPQQVQISIVSPVYKAAALVKPLVSRIEASLKPLGLSYEIVLVDDGSPDQSWAAIEKVAAENEKVKAIKLSRNFGQHKAITCGLDYCAGEWVVVMDCDLQDRPEEIPNLLAKAKEGFDVVLARRKNRQDNWFKRSLSALFYKVLGYLTKTKQDHSIANFGVYNKKVIDVICNMRESTRYFPVMVQWAGFKSSSIDVKHAERESGKTTYSFGKAFSLATEVMLAFSDRPLRLVIRTGVFVCLVAVVMAIYIMIKSFGTHDTVPGWLSLMASIWFLSGLIIFVLGVVGLYVGRSFEETKERPIYIVDQTINHN